MANVKSRLAVQHQETTKHNERGEEMSEIYQRVVANFERDQAHPWVAVTADDLPLSYEAITDQWLTAVLCKAVPGAAVFSHRLSVIDDGSSNRRKIYLDYNDAGTVAGLPPALFCKATHGLTNRILCGISGGVHSETNFYLNIRPLLNIEAPVTVHAKYDPDSFLSIIMLIDLSDSVSEFCSHRTVMTKARVESQMKLLAEMHGRGYTDQRVTKEMVTLPSWQQYFRNTLDFGLQSGACNGFRDAEAVIPPRLFARSEEVWPATLASVALHDHLPVTLTHGDVHVKNWYVAGSGEMGLSDWQVTSRGHWCRDLAYTISTALTPEDRRAWEQDLIKFYLEKLAETGGPVLDFSQAWTLYRQQLPSVLAWWTVTLSPPPGMPADAQPKDITLEFIRRITTAMDDLETLDAF